MRPSSLLLPHAALVALALAWALTGVASADDAGYLAAREAADLAARDAAAAGTSAKWVACGNAYLELHRKFSGPGGDDVLYNAGACFSQGKSVGAALQAYELLLRTFPRSRLAPRALAAAAKAYANIGQLDRAAERLEDYAKKYAAEKDAADALSDATRYRRALGDRKRAIANTQLFVKMFGSKRKREAAQAMIALAHDYDGQPAELLAHLRRVLVTYKLDDAERAYVHATIGDLLSAQSCPVPLHDGLCVRVVPDRSGGTAKTRCSPHIPRVEPVKRRRTLHREAVAAYQAAAQLYRQLPVSSWGRPHAARARLALVDVELERLLGQAFPTGLDFDPARKAVAAKSRKRFDDWLRDTTKLGDDITKQYEAVSALAEPRVALASVARLGQTAQAFWRVARTAELPKGLRAGPYTNEKTAAFCTAFDDRTQALAERARDTFALCLAKAAELGIHDTYTRMCLRDGHALDPKAIRGRELHPDPEVLAIPMLPDTIGAAAWRAKQRDAAIRAWEAAVGNDGTLFAPRVNLAIARLVQLRELPASDSARKQLAADIALHAQRALALGVADPTPLVVLGALALDDGGKLAPAEYYLREALDVSDTYAPAHVGLGVIEVRRDRWSAALAHFERAATLDARAEPVQLALALASLRVGRYDQAAKALSRITTASYDVELARGVAARGLGKSAEAEAAYRRAMKLDARRPEAPHNLKLLASP